jgi:hypothetical protein
MTAFPPLLISSDHLSTVELMNLHAMPNEIDA